MAQEFHRFRGASLNEAYHRMREKLGNDAVVLNTTQVREQGLLGLFGKKVVEVTASAPPTPIRPKMQPAPTGVRAYAEAAQSSRLASEENVADSVAYFQKLV